LNGLRKVLLSEIDVELSPILLGVSERGEECRLEPANGVSWVEQIVAKLCSSMIARSAFGNCKHGLQRLVGQVVNRRRGSLTVELNCGPRRRSQARAIMVRMWRGMGRREAADRPSGCGPARTATGPAAGAIG
jgi:hypothetical protein